MSVQGVARGVGLAGLAAAMVWGAHVAPVRTATGEHLTTTTSPVEAATLVCPGGPGSSGAVELGAFSSPSSLTTFARPGGDARLGAGAGRAPEPFDLTRGGASATRVSGGPLVLEAKGGLAPGLAAAQFSRDGSALSARPCTSSLSESWIPVGNKSDSRLLTLVLVNTGSHAATVDVDVTSHDGDVPDAAIADKAVPANSRVEVSLASEASAHEATVVHVRSEGGAVQSSVRDSAKAGDLQGEELTAQYAVPSTTQVVPAAPVSDGRTLVRLAAPGGRGAVVRLQALSSSGEPSKDRVVTVPRGRTLDVPIDGLSGAAVAVRAVSDSEIVAAAHAPVAKGKPGDFAWAQAAPDMSGAAGASLRGAGAGGDLVLAGSGGPVTATVVVTTKDGHAATHRLVVPKSGARSVALPADSSVWVSAPAQAGHSRLHGAIVLRTGTNDTDQITTLTLTASPWMREQTALVAR